MPRARKPEPVTAPSSAFTSLNENDYDNLFDPAVEVAKETGFSKVVV